MSNKLSSFIKVMCFLLIVLMIAGCGNAKTTENSKPIDRWQFVDESDTTRCSLDTQSIVKTPIDTINAIAVGTLKRDVTSCWIKLDPIQGKEEEFAKKYSKDTAYILVYVHIDKEHRESIFAKMHFIGKDNKLIRQEDQPLKFNSYAPNSLAEKVASKL